MIWGKRGTEQYRAAQRAYNREYQKTPEFKARYREWRKTKVGRAYRLRAATAKYRRHKEWIDSYKIQRGCQECGFNKWPECLDFDHINPRFKSFSISQELIRSKTALLREIEKCRILCANCHRHHSKLNHWRRNA